MVGLCAAVSTQKSDPDIPSDAASKHKKWIIRIQLLIPGLIRLSGPG